MYAESDKLDKNILRPQILAVSGFGNFGDARANLLEYVTGHNVQTEGFRAYVASKDQIETLYCEHFKLLESSLLPS